VIGIASNNIEVVIVGSASSGALGTREGVRIVGGRYAERRHKR